MFFSFLACLPDLNGPAVLATGIGRPNALSLTGEETLFVGSKEGAFFVDYHGKVRADPELSGQNIIGVAAHVERLYALGEFRLAWRSVTEEKWNWVHLEEQPKQLLAWTNNSLLVIYDEGIDEWSVEDGISERWKMNVSGIQDVSYDTENGCGGVLVASNQGVFRVCSDSQELVSQLQVAQISSTRNQIWAIQDDQVGVLTNSGMNEQRRFPAKDMLFGANSLFPDHMLYGVMDTTVELTQCLPKESPD